MISALIDLAKTECPVVRRNCASAMRSMTCKAEIRQLLIASGAIKVILDDATNQVIDFEKKLLSSTTKGIHVAPYDCLCPFALTDFWLVRLSLVGTQVVYKYFIYTPSVISKLSRCGAAQVAW